MSTPPDDDLRALRFQIAALTARVYELERRAGVETATAAAPPPRPSPPPAAKEVPPAPAHDLSAKPAVTRDRGSADLEGRIGRVWINRIGIVATLFGVAYFIKYAFDNNWIGAGGRVAIGIIAGIAVLVWSERFRGKGLVAFSCSLKGVGIGILYLSLWAASSYFHLVPVPASFAAMALVTAFTVILALKQDAEVLMVFALLGGFGTPVSLSTGENHEIILFSYIAVLDLAVLATSIFKPWRRLMWGSFIGTAILFAGWADRFYTTPQRGVTVLFAALFAAIFAAIPLVTPIAKSQWHKGPSVTLMLLPMTNAGALFLALYAMYESEKATLTWYALALGAAYLVLSALVQRRAGAEPQARAVVNMLHVALAITFITIAIPLRLNAHSITIGWLVESAVLLFIGVRTKTSFLRYFAGATLALGVIRLLFVDSGHIQSALLLNRRFATYLVAIAILGGIVAAGQKFAAAREMPFVKLAGLALNLLALVGLTLEAHDYFMRQIDAIVYRTSDAYVHYHQLELAWNFSYSAIWLAYGAGMMAFGFWKRDTFVRWQALVLMALTIGKVFTYDTWNLEKIYRVLSFLGLGVVLMAISYIYHRDWLKLSSRSSLGSGGDSGENSGANPGGAAEGTST
jgi:uncharacterized membrane protein